MLKIAAKSELLSALVVKGLRTKRQRFLEFLWGIWEEDSQIRTHQEHQPGLLQETLMHISICR